MQFYQFKAACIGVLTLVSLPFAAMNSVSSNHTYEPTPTQQANSIIIDASEVKSEEANHDQLIKTTATSLCTYIAEGNLAHQWIVTHLDYVVKADLTNESEKEALSVLASSINYAANAACPEYNVIINNTMENLQHERYSTESI